MEIPVEPAEILNIAEYEKVRPEFRAEIMAMKALRRVQVGEHFNFIFENHRTVLYQIQEMLRVERIVAEEAIAHEVETYNGLIPPQGGLSATLLIEYTDPQARARHLAEMIGIENHVRLAVGGLPPVQGRFDTSQVGEQRISSVQYLLLPLEEAHRRQWQAAAEAGSLKLAVDHPHYAAETAIAPPVAEALAADFS